MIDWVSSPRIVAGQRVVLVLAAPGGPVDPVRESEGGAGDEFGKEVSDLVDSQGDQLPSPVWAGSFLARGDDGEDRVGQHGQGGVAVPGVPGADLVLVEADLALTCLETRLDAPADAGDPYEGFEADLGG